VRLRPALGRLAAVLVLAIGGWLGGAGTEPVAAAAPALTLVASARYDVQPDQHRVHVTVALAATNHRSDTVIRRFWFDHANLAVLPGTTNFRIRAVGSTAHPTVGVASRSGGQTLLRIGFGTKLGSGRTLNMRLTFDLPDPGGKADRDVRIGNAIATFPVWGFGSTDTPGGSVTVVMPAGFRVEVLGGPLAGPTVQPNGTLAFSATNLARPLTFFAYVLADRPGAYAVTPLNLSIAGERVPLVVEAWQDDAAFGRRTATLLRQALPALGSAIGVPVPLAREWASGTPGVGALTVREAVTRTSGGYAALFDPATGRIEVAYDAAPFVVLHEASHAWFNGWLLTDRWAAEGFASYYAGLAAKPLKVAVPSGLLTEPLMAAKVPLNAWQPDIVASRGSGDRTQDAYAFAASRKLAELIAQRAGPAGLTRVWAAAAAGESADQPAHGSGEVERDVGGAPAPEPSTEPSAEPSAEPSEEPSAESSVGPSAEPSVAPSAGSTASPSGSLEVSPEASPASSESPGPSAAVGTSMDTGPYTGTRTGTSPGSGASAIERDTPAPDWRSLLDLLETRTDATYDDLWRTWVVRPEEAVLLDQRATAREAYAAAVVDAGDWELPRAIRTALDRWQFDDAMTMIGKARAVLDARDDLANDAAAAGVTLPSTVRDMFERQGPEAAQAEVATESAAIARIASDAHAEPADPGIVESIGLYGETPATQMDAARTAFASGDLAGAVAAADIARDTWQGSSEAGRGRLALAAGGLAAFGLMLLAWSRRRRPRRPAGKARQPMAHSSAQSSAGSDPHRPDSR
jgi:hypothetical protein